MKVKILNKSHKLGKYQGKIAEVVECITPRIGIATNVKLYKLKIGNEIVVGKDNLIYNSAMDIEFV